MNKILNYLEDDNWYKIFDAENEEDIEYKLLERKEVETLLKEVERLNNIIKEVREYIENKQELNKMFGTITLSKESQKELLEILDKENK